LLQATAPQVARTTTGRICRGGEVDPLYLDVIIRRYQSFEAATRVRKKRVFPDGLANGRVRSEAV
jgi:DNA modification methylase